VLLEINNFCPEEGHCWTAPAPVGIGPGDSLGNSSQSKLRLFENGREIGPGHSLHTDIRAIGQGRFSHWGNAIYFSSSDNSNPNNNGRQYMALYPDPEEELHQQAAFAQAFAIDHTLVRKAISKSLATQGSAFHSIISAKAVLSCLAKLNRPQLSELTILEIGASPTLGLTMALALLGVKKIIANNIAPINNHLSEDFLRCLQVLLNLQGEVKRAWSDVATPDDSAGTFRVNPEIIQLLGGTDAAQIPSSLGPVDAIFSISVFEHIRHLPLVLRKTRELMGEQAVFFHIIDLRDHTDFADPLKYLRLSPEAFTTTYSAEHNRWRASQYLDMFKQAGLNVIKCSYSGQLPAGSGTSTDMWSIAEKGLDSYFYNLPQEIPAKISEAERALLAPEFASLSISELSVMAIEVLGCRN
jgi:hypothetical protein